MYTIYYEFVHIAVFMCLYLCFLLIIRRQINFTHTCAVIFCEYKLIVRPSAGESVREQQFYRSEGFY